MLKILLFLLVVIICFIISRILINNKSKKGFINVVKLLCREYAEWLNKLYIDYTNEETKREFEKEYEITNEESIKNLTFGIEDIYFSPILFYNKASKKDIKEYIMQFEKLELLPEDNMNALVDLEKRDIGNGLYFYYFMKYKKEIGVYNDEELSIIYNEYFNSLKYTDFDNILKKDPFKINKLTFTHYKPEVQSKDFFYKYDSYYKRRNNLLSAMQFNDFDSKFFDEYINANEQRVALTKAHSLDDLIEYKNKFYSIKNIKEISLAFNNILEDDRKIPIFDTHVCLDFNIEAKILMYLNLDKKKIEFKEIVKEENDETFHTIRSKYEYPELFSSEYFMYLYSYIFLVLDNIIKEDENHEEIISEN